MSKFCEINLPCVIDGYNDIKDSQCMDTVAAVTFLKIFWNNLSCTRESHIFYVVFFSFAKGIFLCIACGIDLWYIYYYYKC